MGRRLLLTLLVGALAATAWCVARPGSPPHEGLVVHVYVVDEAGDPIENAQVQKTFAPGWKVMTAEGHKRLTRVPLREGERPSATALRTAVQVRARFYALHSHLEADVKEREDGSWEMRFPLIHHGVLRVHVRDTHLGEAKAYPEPPGPLRLWEAMDAGNVARPGRPAAYRVYPGLEHVVVRLVGEPDMHGATGIATRRYFFRAPSPGHLVEKTVVPDAIVPILGSVEAPTGPRPPTLRGEVKITELAAGGRRIPHDPVPIEDDGRFVIRTLGAGRYELEAAGLFLMPMPKATAEAGDVVTMKGAKLRPWLLLRHPGVDAEALGLLYRVGWSEVEQAVQAAVLYRPDHSVIALPRGGTWHVYASVPGDQEQPPLDLRAKVEAPEAGPVEAVAEIEPAPHGALIVRPSADAWASHDGATVTVHGRHHTLMRKVAESVEIPHVRAGRVEVWLEWNDPGAAHASMHVEVKAGETTIVEFEVP